MRIKNVSKTYQNGAVGNQGNQPTTLGEGKCVWRESKYLVCDRTSVTKCLSKNLPPPKSGKYKYDVILLILSARDAVFDTKGMSMRMTF